MRIEVLGCHGGDVPNLRLPTFLINGQLLLEAGVPAYALLQRAGLVASNGEGRRLVRGGGARLNDVPIEAEDRPITAADLAEDGALKLSAGRKRHVLVRAE